MNSGKVVTKCYHDMCYYVIGRVVSEHSRTAPPFLKIELQRTWEEQSRDQAAVLSCMRIYE